MALVLISVGYIVSLCGLVSGYYVNECVLN